MLLLLLFSRPRPSSSHIRSPDIPDAAPPPRRRALTWDTAVEQGEAMMCEMQKSPFVYNAPATTIDEMRDPGGWSVEKERDVYYDDVGELQLALESFSVPFPDDTAFLQYRMTWNYLGTITPTGSTTPVFWKQALMLNSVNVESGVIISFANYSPTGQARKAGLSPADYASKLPAIHQWSDCMFVAWSDLCSTGYWGDMEDCMPRLQHQFQIQITNEDTIGIMDQCYQNELVKGKTTTPGWDGRLTYTPEDDEFHALLYTPNLRGLGWMLSQHKMDFGVKIVDSISIFKETLIEIEGEEFVDEDLNMDEGEDEDQEMADQEEDVGEEDGLSWWMYAHVSDYAP